MRGFGGSAMMNARHYLATVVLSLGVLILVAPAAVAQTEAQLKYACKQFVESSLHDPTGAQLEWTKATVSRAKSGDHVVEFRGRAKNAYGALRLSTFQCVIRYSAPDNFRAVSVRARE
jgi:hypothetical protein